MQAKSGVGNGLLLARIRRLASVSPWAVTLCPPTLALLANTKVEEEVVPNSRY